MRTATTKHNVTETKTEIDKWWHEQRHASRRPPLFCNRVHTRGPHKHWHTHTEESLLQCNILYIAPRSQGI
jgi:hypothetical protein